MFRLTVARATRAPIVANRAFSTTYAAYKLPEPVEKVNRAAGDTLLKGIETVESATESVKEAAQPITEKVSEVSPNRRCSLPGVEHVSRYRIITSDHTTTFALSHAHYTAHWRRQGRG